jgi:fatty-acyl-CoA synthase
MPGIGFWLTKRELLNGNREALVDGERRLTYRQLNRRVNQLARFLQGMGLKRGDRCAILAYNCLEFVEVIFATAKLGLILVPLNWRLAPAELSFIISDSGAETLFFDPEFAAAVESLKGKTALRRFISIGQKEIAGATPYEKALTSQRDEEPGPDRTVELNTPHIIMYTAGTTGRPKGAVLGQGASFWNAVNMSLCVDLTSKDRTLTVLPLFHVGGIGLYTLPTLYQGGTAVIQRTFDPKVTFRLIKDERIDVLFGVPAIFLFLIQDSDFKSGAMSRLRSVMSGGAPLPVSLIHQYHEAGIILQQGFGMSEAAPGIAALDRDRALAKAGSIGRPLFHLEVRIVDDQNHDQAVGQTGELLIRGPNLMQGYWNRPEATAEAFMEGWLHTGDLARMDEDGDLYIVERKKDMYISGGENVYPAEVENTIFELPQVAEAAIIGVKDKTWGEVGQAIVVLKPGQKLTETEVLNFLKGRLAKYKVPKSVVFVDQLPRNAAGKVLKNVLKEKYSS